MVWNPILKPFPTSHQGGEREGKRSLGTLVVWRPSYPDVTNSLLRLLRKINKIYLSSL